MFGAKLNWGVCMVLGLVLGQQLAAPGQSARDRSKGFEDTEDNRWKFKLRRELAESKRTMPQLLRAKVAAARDAVEDFLGYVEAGQKDVSDLTLLDLAKLLAQAELEISRTQAERIAILERLWMLYRKAELLSEARVSFRGSFGLALARIYRLDAEIKLVKARQERPGKLFGAPAQSVRDHSKNDSKTRKTTGSTLN
jgi:hypothetical protein